MILRIFSTRFRWQEQWLMSTISQGYKSKFAATTASTSADFHQRHKSNGRAPAGYSITKNRGQQTFFSKDEFGYLLKIVNLFCKSP